MTKHKVYLTIFLILAFSVTVSAFRRYYYPNRECKGSPRIRINLKNHQNCQPSMYPRMGLRFTSPCVEGQPLPYIFFKRVSGKKCEIASSEGVMRPRKGCVAYEDYSVLTDCIEEDPPKRAPKPAKTQAPK